MPLGQVVGGLFFVMLVIAALTSAISLSEPSIAWLTERFRISRTKAVLGSGLVLWLLSLGSVFSFNHWADYQLFGKTFFDTLDYLTTNWLMPLGGLGTVLFTGWVLQNRWSAKRSASVATACSWPGGTCCATALRWPSCWCSSTSWV